MVHDRYKADLIRELKLALCVRVFPSQEAASLYRPEVEFATRQELLLPKAVVAREGTEECCLIEKSINSCRISFKFQLKEPVGAFRVQQFFTFLGRRAELLPLLRKVPVHGYHLTFLLTAENIQQYKPQPIIGFIIKLALEMADFQQDLYRQECLF